MGTTVATNALLIRKAGKTGKNSVTRKNRTIQTAGGNDEVMMEPGDVFSIETPGDGGFGPLSNQQSLPCVIIFFLDNISFHLDS